MKAVVALFVNACLHMYAGAISHLSETLDKAELIASTQSYTQEHSLIQSVCSIRREQIALRTTGRRLRTALRTYASASAGAGAAAGDVGGLEHVADCMERLMGVRECAHSLLEVLLAVQNNRMQATMQTLAVVTVIFVPLTFLAGIEGMNFVNQPELSGKWNYGIFWVVVGLLVVAQLMFFKRRGWI